eukprot:1013530-Rhodomonas_salina.1
MLRAARAVAGVEQHPRGRRTASFGPPPTHAQPHVSRPVCQRTRRKRSAGLTTPPLCLCISSELPGPDTGNAAAMPGCRKCSGALRAALAALSQPQRS